eukprot:TRINITY_DN3873_c0_g1_i1.p1 TRINITY_DN3873_c0_g1~~TRINITY_DN3873_c0_g1_i1.p1  ORF type:complete len:208 (+),score=56.20 TRINITY_DN3873_c0_g1_i1:172-795(+)
MSEGQPYFVGVVRKRDSQIVYAQYVGAQTRHPSADRFDRLMVQMMDAKNMRTIPERIVKVADLELYISYRRDDQCGVVFFVLAPLSYSKSVLRQLLKEVQVQFDEGLVDAGIPDEAVQACAPKDLTKRSQIRHHVSAAVEKFGSGVATSDRILTQLDKNKETLGKSIDAVTARTDSLEDQVQDSQELVEVSEDFGDKTSGMPCCVLA